MMVAAAFAPVSNAISARTLASGAVNVLLVSTVAAFGSHAPFAGAPLGVVVGVLWFALVLPSEVVSSYLTGRGSATRRIAAVANAAVTGA